MARLRICAIWIYVLDIGSQIVRLGVLSFFLRRVIISVAVWCNTLAAFVMI